MRIDVHQMHGKDHDKNRDDPNRDGCGCMGDPGRAFSVDVPTLPPVGSGIWVQGRSGAWREVTVERYTFGDPTHGPDRILCWASYNRED